MDKILKDLIKTIKKEVKARLEGDKKSWSDYPGVGRITDYDVFKHMLKHTRWFDLLNPRNWQSVERWSGLVIATTTGRTRQKLREKETNFGSITKDAPMYLELWKWNFTSKGTVPILVLSIIIFFSKQTLSK